MLFLFGVKAYLHLHGSYVPEKSYEDVRWMEITHGRVQ
jgi:hypothetical protein